MSQDGAVRDFVLPLMTVEPDLQGGGVRMIAFEGTGFLLSEPADTVVTAGHVAAKLEVGRAVAAFVDDGGWSTWGIVRITRHHAEDLAVLKLAPGHGHTSPLFVGGTDMRASARYRLGVTPWTSCTRSSRTDSPFRVRTSSTARDTFDAVCRTYRWGTCEGPPS